MTESLANRLGVEVLSRNNKGLPKSHIPSARPSLISASFRFKLTYSQRKMAIFSMDHPLFGYHLPGLKPREAGHPLEFVPEVEDQRDSQDHSDDTQKHLADNQGCQGDDHGKLDDIPDNLGVQEVFEFMNADKID